MQGCPDFLFLSLGCTRFTVSAKLIEDVLDLANSEASFQEFSLELCSFPCPSYPGHFTRGENKAENGEVNILALGLVFDGGC